MTILRAFLHISLSPVSQFFFSFQVPNNSANVLGPAHELIYIDILGHFYFHMKLTAGCKAQS